MNFYSVVGLALDFVGVIFLGYDLIRLQVAIRKRTQRSRTLFDEIESDYGGIESWANDIMEQSQWIPSSAYSRYHFEDEVSYNARHALDGLRDISSAVNGLAVHIVKVTENLRDTAVQDRVLASSTLRFSIFGLAFLMVGFGLQIVGAWSTN